MEVAGIILFLVFIAGILCKDLIHRDPAVRLCRKVIVHRMPGIAGII